MKYFNLSKFYVLNFMIWLSLIGNIIPIILAVISFKFLFPVKTANDLFANLVILEIYYILFFLILLLCFLLFIVELFLRKYNKILNYNQKTIHKTLNTILYWLGIILIPVSIYIFYIIFNFNQYIYDKNLTHLFFPLC